MGSTSAPASSLASLTKNKSSFIIPGPIPSSRTTSSRTRSGISFLSRHAELDSASLIQLHRSLAIRGSAATAHLRWALGKGPPRCAVAVHQHPTTNIVIPDSIRNLHPTFFFHPPESHTANASIQHHRPGLSIALDNTTNISRHAGPDPASLNPRSTYQTVGNSNSLIINHRILLRK